MKYVKLLEQLLVYGKCYLHVIIIVVNYEILSGSWNLKFLALNYKLKQRLDFWR